MSKYNPHCRKATVRKKPLDPRTTGTLFDVLRELGVGEEDWDVLLIGDGSGTDWKNSIGFSCVLIDHFGNYRVPFFGGLNTGTSQLAELLPYMLALTWYKSGPGKQRKEYRKSRQESVMVHVITDNQNLANWGNRQARRNAYPEFWAVYDYFESSGFSFHWHWMPRTKVGLNRLTDMVAAAMRKLLEGATLPDGSLVRDVDLYSINPVTTEEPPAKVD